MNIIAAASRNWGIGKDNGLLFNIPTDMKFFRETTMGKVVIMGRKTLESFPGARPLPKRENIVLSRNPDYAPEGVTVCRTPQEVLAEAKKHDSDDVFVIGGAQIYRMMIPFCKRAYITLVDAEPEADSFLPDFTKLVGWRLADATDAVEENGVRFNFNIFENDNTIAF